MFIVLKYSKTLFFIGIFSPSMSELRLNKFGEYFNERD